MAYSTACVNARGVFVLLILSDTVTAQYVCTRTCSIVSPLAFALGRQDSFLYSGNGHPEIDRLSQCIMIELDQTTKSPERVLHLRSWFDPPQGPSPCFCPFEEHLGECLDMNVSCMARKTLHTRVLEFVNEILGPSTPSLLDLLAGRCVGRSWCKGEFHPIYIARGEGSEVRTEFDCAWMGVWDSIQNAQVVALIPHAVRSAQDERCYF